MGRFRQRVKRGAAAMSVMRQIMCLLNIEACKPVLVETQTKSMNLKMSRICPPQGFERKDCCFITVGQSCTLI